MEGFQFKTQLKVRYSEIDGQKIVFNAHYMTYLDIAISEYYSKGLQLDYVFADGIFDFVLAKSTLEYKQPARLNDVLDLWCRTVKIGRTSFVNEFVITRTEELDPLVKAEIIYVSIDPKTLKPQPMPELVRNRIEQFECDVDF
ncbi:acyl-CoA thioesterase [Pueribacillus sp. YX66]|uniref:acyl-CoA thioesterase n=1 Tax=Pueribacillus sp. YX66 TaxID=3229242 RepID=UPI00358D20DD